MAIIAVIVVVALAGQHFSNCKNRKLQQRQSNKVSQNRLSEIFIKPNNTAINIQVMVTKDYQQETP